MSDMRRVFVWTSFMTMILGAGPAAWAGGGHGRQPAVGGYTVGSPMVVLGSAPAGGGHLWHRWHTVGAMGGVPATAPPLGVAYTLVPTASSTGATTAPSLGMGYSYGPTVVLGGGTPVLGGGTVTYAYPTVSYTAGGGGSAAPSLGAGQSSEPEAMLGHALGGPNLKRIKDHVLDLIEDQTSNGKRPARRKLIRLLTDGAMEFARHELRLDLVNWLPVVRDLVTNLVSDEVGPAESGGDEPAEAAPRPRPSSSANGRQSIPIQASGYLVIDRIYVDGEALPTPAVKPATPVDSPGATTPPAGDDVPRDTGPLLPEEGNDG